VRQQVRVCGEQRLGTVAEPSCHNMQAALDLLILAVLA
jgi:hypothetical protein